MTRRLVALLLVLVLALCPLLTKVSGDLSKTSTMSKIA